MYVVFVQKLHFCICKGNDIRFLCVYWKCFLFAVCFYVGYISVWLRDISLFICCVGGHVMIPHSDNHRMHAVETIKITQLICEFHLFWKIFRYSKGRIYLANTYWRLNVRENIWTKEIKMHGKLRKLYINCVAYTRAGWFSNNAIHLNTVGAYFESWLWHELFSLFCFCFSSVPPGKHCGIYYLD